MSRKNRYFEVILNGNFFFPSYTLVVKNEKIAVQKAVKEAKFNRNITVDVIEVDENGDLIECGFCSGPIKIC
jgi:flagellar basal body L-ring protein FlgH